MLKSDNPDTAKKADKPKVYNELNSLNSKLQDAGLLPLAIVNPNKLVGQKKNARYFTPNTFKTLVENIKRENALESVPLVHKVGDVYEIISGHHRVDAAKAAGLKEIIVMVHRNLTHDEMRSKQLSHNALTGIDDKILLSELFNEIQSIEQRMATGLSDEVGKISYESINFRVGTFEELTIMFAPDDIAKYDDAMERLANDSFVKSSTTVRLAPMSCFDKLANLLRKIKKTEKTTVVVSQWNNLT